MPDQLKTIGWPDLRDEAIRQANKHGYGVPAFNINIMEHGLAIMSSDAATEFIDAFDQALSRYPGLHASGSWL